MTATQTAPGPYALSLYRERQVRLARMSPVAPPKKPPLPADIIVYPTHIHVDAGGDVCASPDLDQPDIGPGMVREIQDMVCKLLKVRRIDLLSGRHHRMSVMARQIAMYLCKRHTPLSLPDLGRRFGGRDHTTVLYAVARVELMVSMPMGTSAGKQWASDYCDLVRKTVALAEAALSTWPARRSRVRHPSRRP